MYWKFILVNLLLVLPNSRILGSESNGFGNTYFSEPEYSDKMYDDIQQSGNNILHGQENINQEIGSNDDAFQQELVRQKPEQPKIVNDISDEGLSKAVVPPESEVNSQGSVSAYAAPGKAELLQQQQHSSNENRYREIIDSSDTQFIIIVAVAVSTSFVGLMLAGVCYYKFRKSAKAASDVEYPVYGVTGPVKERIPSPGDRKLAQSAQMYHYQHQKQQMIAMEKANGDMKHDASDDDSEEDNIEGDYTVYECPGLAPTGEMEVRNPLFRADDTPVTPGEDITGQPHGQDLPHERGNQ